MSAAFNLADVLPARIVLFWSTVGAAAANVFLILANGPETAVPLRFLTGLFLAGVYPVSLKLIATWFQESRGMALGVMVGALTLGSATPHLVNGLGGIGWEVVILATSLLTLGGAVITAGVIREGPFPIPQGGFRPSPDGQGLRQSRRPPGFIGLLRTHVGALRHVGLVSRLLLGPPGGIRRQ